MSFFDGAESAGRFGSGDRPTASSIMEQAAKAELSKNLAKNLGPFIIGWVISLQSPCRVVSSSSTTLSATAYLSSPRLSKVCRTKTPLYQLGRVILPAEPWQQNADSRWTVDFILFGVMLHQTIQWSINFRSERKFSKVVVVSLSPAWLLQRDLGKT